MKSPFLAVWRFLFGRKRKPRGGRYRFMLREYNLARDLHVAIEDLAEMEGRPVDEVAADLIASALVLRQSNVFYERCWHSLTPREQQVGALIAMNYTYRMIGGRLGISAETVKTHAYNAMHKFGVRSREELAQVLSRWDFHEWETKGRQ